MVHIHLILMVSHIQSFRNQHLTGKNGFFLANHLYVIMDTNKEDEDLAKVCAPPIGTGTMNCDFDGDGVSDIIGGGDRSWLYLDYDINNIKKIILGQIEVPCCNS